MIVVLLRYHAVKYRHIILAHLLVARPDSKNRPPFARSRRKCNRQILENAIAKIVHHSRKEDGKITIIEKFHGETL